ncbi:MAG: aminotransferase class V-fold PLP-dependent enzyme [Candidatus Latescibacteria bacterium]|nr:aminotransferase class V-fold PLP-dependent enzyme [Candidatus Latescibacterota bacterium]
MFDLTNYRKLFLLTENYNYLNHASTGPLPMPAVMAISDMARKYSEQGMIEWQEYEQLSNSTRVLAAELLNCSNDEICFVQNTSQGIIYAIGSIGFEKGDNVILMQDAFPTNSAPFRYLLPEVEKRYVASREVLDNPDCILKLIDAKTKAVSLDWVNFLNGIRIDLKRIAQICKEHKVYFIVDGMQGCGAVRIDLGDIQPDFFSSAAPKWLLGPHGIGILYVNKSILGNLKPCNLGWLSAEWDNFYDIAKPRKLKPTAARFEEGTKNYLGMVGFKESLKLFDQIGIDKIEAQVLDLTSYLLDKIATPQFEIITPKNRRERAGIVSFKRKDKDSAELYQKLKENNIVCSLRNGYLRISPHFYNTKAEIDQLVSFLL